MPPISTNDTSFFELLIDISTSINSFLEIYSKHFGFNELLLNSKQGPKDSS